MDCKVIAGYPDYTISTNGDVTSYRRSKAGKVMKGGVHVQGYRQINLSKDGSSKTERLHRLVTQAFIPNPDNKEEVNHIDGDKLNNNVTNLEWCTSSENTQHAWDTGLRPDCTKHLRSAIIKLRSEGLSYANIAKELGCGTVTAWNHINKN